MNLSDIFPLFQRILGLTVSGILTVSVFLYPAMSVSTAVSGSNAVSVSWVVSVIVKKKKTFTPVKKFIYAKKIFLERCLIL